MLYEVTHRVGPRADLNKVDQDMEISDRQAPRQQLLTLSLGGESMSRLTLYSADLFTHTAQINCPFTNAQLFAVVTLRSACPVAHLRAVTDFACRNLPDGLFQLRHQHFVEHQERVPGDKGDNDKIHFGSRENRAVMSRRGFTC